MLCEYKIIKEKYRNIYKMLPRNLQEACRAWAKLENWDETTWIETLQALVGMFENYEEAERWIRRVVLPSLGEPKHERLQKTA
jgi:hypothetical protein